MKKIFLILFLSIATLSFSESVPQTKSQQQVVEYITVSSKDLREAVELINDLIAKGYQPYGPLLLKYTNYFEMQTFDQYIQVMVKYK